MRTLTPLFGVLLLLGNLFAEIVPVPGTQPVAPVFAAADLVCNCIVESLRITEEQKLERSGRTVLRRRVVARVRVKDSYKGGVPPGTLIQVAFEEETPTTSASMPELSDAETALMFLKVASPSIYEFADPSLGVRPFTSLPLQNNGLGLSRLQSALTGAIQNGGRDDQINAMRLLEGFDELSPETIAVLSPFTFSGNPEIALSSIAVLLKAKVPGSVQTLESYLRGHKMSAAPVAVLSIGGELGLVDNIEDLAPLEALTSSEYLSIKLGAIGGVRRIRSPHSAKALVERLDDPNADIRYLAVISLSEIFSKSGDYAPTSYLFDKNPEFYTIQWKTWWAENGRNLSR